MSALTRRHLDGVTFAALQVCRWLNWPWHDHAGAADSRRRRWTFWRFCPSVAAKWQTINRHCLHRHTFRRCERRYRILGNWRRLPSNYLPVPAVLFPQLLPSYTVHPYARLIMLRYCWIFLPSWIHYRTGLPCWVLTTTVHPGRPRSPGWIPFIGLLRLLPFVCYAYHHTDHSGSHYRLTADAYTAAWFGRVFTRTRQTRTYPPNAGLD